VETFLLFCFVDQEGEGSKCIRRSRDDSLSISGLVLCCYLRRWNSVDGVDDEESTAVTQEGMAECRERNMRRSVSENSFQTGRHRYSKASYSCNKFDNAVFEDSSPPNSPPKEEIISIGLGSSSKN